MWWRNLEISKKLLLGFGLIVFLFVIIVFVTYSYMSDIEGSSIMLTDEVSPELRLLSSYNKQVSEVFLAMSTVERCESPEAIEFYRKQVEKALSIRNKIAAINKKSPELLGPDYIISKVIPFEEQYNELSERTLALISKKQDLLSGFTKKEQEISESAATLHNNFYKRLQRTYVEANLANAKTMSDELEMCSKLLEGIMLTRRNTWHAITLANASSNIDDMRLLPVRVRDMQILVVKMKPLLSKFPEEGKELEKLISDLNIYEKYVSELANTCVELHKVHSARIPVLDSFNAECNAAHDVLINRVQIVSNSNIENLHKAISAMIVLAFCCVILAVLISLSISGNISKPLKKIVNYARQIGDGNLTIKKADFDYEGKDEMGNMVTALADMVDSQSAMMTQIVTIAKNLAKGANNLATISQETNASMEEVKASISQAKDLSESNGVALEESNAGVEEMSAGADTVAHSATESAAFIAQTTEASNNALETMRNVIEVMYDVDKNSKASELKIQQLVSSVENVSSFVSVITGIADQTNLLALNAAIEAARAGEVGRGFAVVAEEVRKLAEESARAAQNVNGIIQELQTGAQESIKATTDASYLLASTLQHAEEALSELNDALGQIKKASDSIQSIAAIAEEQAVSSKEVAQAIDNAAKSSISIAETISNIHFASDETAKASEGVAIHAESMASFSDMLSDLLSNLKLNEHTINEDIPDNSISSSSIGKITHETDVPRYGLPGHRDTMPS